MNRRDTLKSLLAGLFVDWLPKKVDAKPIVFDEMSPCKEYKVSYRCVSIANPPTSWITHIYSTEDLLWDHEILPCDNCETMEIFGKTYKVLPDGHTIMYVGKDKDSLRQLIGVAKVQDGRTLLQLGYRKDEVHQQPIYSIKAYAEQAMSDLRELEWQVC